MKQAKQASGRAVQLRTTLTRSRIVSGAIRILSKAGVASLTHRALADEAGVSLAATTYHFATKDHILEAASHTLLADNVYACERLEQRIRAGVETAILTLDNFVSHLVLTMLGRERERSLAWCEIILNGGRTTAGRRLAREWFTQLDRIYSIIARCVDPALGHEHARLALCEVVGLIFLLHPLRLDPTALRLLLSGRLDPEEIASRRGDRRWEFVESSGSRATPERARSNSRERIVDAAVDVLILKGIGAISYRSVAETVGMARSGPSYHFPTISSLLEATEHSLFSRARARYRAGIAAWSGVGMDASRLTEVSTAILIREIQQFGQENLGFYLVRLGAARTDDLRATATGELLASYRGWRRRLTETAGIPVDKRSPFRLQAIFVGMLLRAIVTGADPADCSLFRADLAVAINRAVAEVPAGLTQRPRNVTTPAILSRTRRRYGKH